MLTKCWDSVVDGTLTLNRFYSPSDGGGLRKKKVSLSGIAESILKRLLRNFAIIRI